MAEVICDPSTYFTRHLVLLPTAAVSRDLGTGHYPVANIQSCSPLPRQHMPIAPRKYTCTGNRDCNCLFQCKRSAGPPLLASLASSLPSNQLAPEPDKDLAIVSWT